MSDRKAELERKKAKLQALREEKDRRRREKEQKDVEEATVSLLIFLIRLLYIYQIVEIYYSCERRAAWEVKVGVIWMKCYRLSG